MELFEKINNDIKTAMKAKESDKLEALRAIKSQLLLLKTSGSGKEITPEDELKVLQKMVKQRKESAEIYQSQNRDDLFQKEIKEVEFIQAYLPDQISDEELTKIIQEIIIEVGAQTIKDMGKVIGLANKRLSGQAEGKAIADKVKQLLNL